IANDGNLLPRAVKLTMLDEQGIAERYDIVIDFSKYTMGTKLHLVNCCEHQDGSLPAADLTLGQALSGASHDPCVGRFLEFRIVRPLSAPDKSFVPGFSETSPASSVVPTSQWPHSPFLIPNPDHSQLPISAERTFEFNRGANVTTGGPTSAENGSPWGIATNSGGTLAAD